MSVGLKRLLGAAVLRLLRQGPRNRQRLFGGERGLRILTFHAMQDRDWDHFRRVVERCSERFDLAEPSDVDALADGRLRVGARDRLLFSFDDGHEQDFRVAEWLAECGIRAVFFVIPSYIGRTVKEFLAYHQARGVRAHDLARGSDHTRTRGLSQSQVREMAAMGHRIGAHNFAHRDLATLHAPKELDYELGEALQSISSLLGQNCEDFAWAFGGARHVSEEAALWLRDRCPRVYSCVRGLNVPGLTPAFLLRDTIYPDRSFLLSSLFLEGGVDHQWSGDRERLMQWAGPLAVSRRVT